MRTFWATSIYKVKIEYTAFTGIFSACTAVCDCIFNRILDLELDAITSELPSRVVFMVTTVFYETSTLLYFYLSLARIFCSTNHAFFHLDDLSVSKVQFYPCTANIEYLQNELAFHPSHTRCTSYS